MTFGNEQDQYTLHGSLVSVTGRNASVKISKLPLHMSAPNLSSVTVIGKAGPTNSEKLDSYTVLLALQHKKPIFESRWFDRLFKEPPSDQPPPKVEHDKDVTQVTDSWAEMSFDPWSISVDGAVQACNSAITGKTAEMHRK